MKMHIQNRYVVRSTFDDREVIYFVWDRWEETKVVMKKKKLTWLDHETFVYTADRKFAGETARHLNKEIKRYTYVILEYVNQ